MLVNLYIKGRQKDGQNTKRSTVVNQLYLSTHLFFIIVVHHLLSYTSAIPDDWVSKQRRSEEHVYMNSFSTPKSVEDRHFEITSAVHRHCRRI